MLIATSFKFYLFFSLLWESNVKVKILLFVFRWELGGRILIFTKSELLVVIQMNANVWVCGKNDRQNLKKNDSSGIPTIFFWRRKKLLQFVLSWFGIFHWVVVKRNSGCSEYLNIFSSSLPFLLSLLLLRNSLTLMYLTVYFSYNFLRATHSCSTTDLKSQLLPEQTFFPSFIFANKNFVVVSFCPLHLFLTSSLYYHNIWATHAGKLITPKILFLSLFFFSLLIRAIRRIGASLTIISIYVSKAINKNVTIRQLFYGNGN